MGGENFCRVSRGSLGIYSILKEFCTGEHVAIPWNVCPDVVFAIRAANKIPYFIDYFSRDEPITPKMLSTIPNYVTCLMHVHIYGAFYNITARMRNRFSLIIDDAAQAIGSYNGDLVAGYNGDFGVFSFGKTKQCDLGGGGLIYAKNLNDAILLEKNIAEYSVLSTEQYETIRSHNSKIIKSKLGLFEKNGIIEWLSPDLDAREIFKNYDGVLTKEKLVTHLCSYDPVQRISTSLSFSNKLANLNLECHTYSPGDNVWRIVVKPINFDFSVYVRAFKHLRNKGHACSNWYYPANEIFGFKINGNPKLTLDDICRFQFLVEGDSEGFSILNEERILGIMRKYYA